MTNFGSGKEKKAEGEQKPRMYGWEVGKARSNWLVCLQQHNKAVPFPAASALF